MSYLLEGLNPEQRAAVTTTEGPLLVIAGAGSGKTRVIVHRIAYLLDQGLARPEQILAVTFTNKAALEMKERVHQLVPASRRRGELLISTFHSFCVRALRRHLDRFGGAYTRDFTIYDADDQGRLVKACLKELGLDDKKYPPRAMQYGISAAKNRGETPETLPPSSDPKRDALIKTFRLYERRLAAANALDFDDLLLLTVRLLRRFQDVADDYNDRFRYILIDEYQDTNPPQLNLARLLTQQRQNLCAVGDPDQSIYKFRAADIRNILDFERHYPKAKTIILAQNYRSTKTILDAANAVIRNNRARPNKDLATRNAAGEPIRCFVAANAEEEADFIVREIIAWQRRHEHLRPEETRAAILYRTNAQSRLFEEACRRRLLPYVLVGGFSFYERAEIKDALAYLRLLLNPHDDAAFDRVVNVPPRGVGKSTLEALAARAGADSVSRWTAMTRLLEEGGLSARALTGLTNFASLIASLQRLLDAARLADLVSAVVTRSGYADLLEQEGTLEAEGRKQNLEELVSAAAEADERGERLREFLDRAALVADTDDLVENARVTLMTIHSAKGLEFPLVFVAGLEEGLLPHARVAQDEDDLEEERRLFYVAVTRAKRQLYLTQAERRRVYGNEVATDPSRFLDEIPEALMTVQSGAGTAARRADDGRPSLKPPAKIGAQRLTKPKPAAAQGAGRDAPASAAGGLRVGDRVEHATYGAGQIVRVADGKLDIAFPGRGIKRFVAEAAPLTKIARK
ncbi:MAG: ATP-dependent DNA helicase PcrA [Chloracidobacterium sp. CP2_5A]|nr:MAG: ATP-dependent DNA helicase PcrA [Chloracidobacterium sp. CP2_5A]